MKGFRVLTCGKETGEADPGKPCNPAERLNTAEAESNDGGDRDEDGGAGTVGGDTVQADGCTEHSRTGNEDPICAVLELFLSTLPTVHSQSTTETPRASRPTRPKNSPPTSSMP